MAKMRFTPTEREHVRLRVAQLYLQGWAQSRIAEETGVTASQVSRYLKAIRQRWVDQQLEYINEVKARQLAKIDHLETTYWEAWERSLGLHEVTTTKETEKASVEVTVKAEELNGDPRYLEGVRWCITERGKLLGLYEQTLTVKGEVTTVVRSLSDDLAAQLLAALRAMPDEDESEGPSEAQEGTGEGSTP